MREEGEAKLFRDTVVDEERRDEGERRMGEWWVYRQLSSSISSSSTACSSHRG